jgi:hypothetical protein
MKKVVDRRQTKDVYKVPLFAAGQNFPASV